MAQALRAEFRKLLTVRSTYLLALLIVVLSVLFTYFGTSKEPVITDNNQQTSESSQVQNNKPPEIK
jgi:preprotein translocase subunit SecG